MHSQHQMALRFNYGLPDRSAMSARRHTQEQSSLEDGDHWYSMDDEYGLEDLDAIPSDSTEALSVKDEYRAYVSTPTSRHSDDLVRFWEASSYSFVNFSSHIHHSRPSICIPFFSRWRWITSPSRHLQCPVSGLSPQERRLLQCVGTAYNLR
jgi:hypothetical protein